MNTDFYRNYIRIVECGTLSSAARELHIAQSALSTQVKQFEDEYGTPLFIRNARKMVPTDAGKILYEKAKNIVLLLDASHKEIDAFVKGAQGTVRIGMTQAHSDSDITNLLLGFQRENPFIHYEFYELNSGEIMELLQAGVIEVGIIQRSGLLPPFLKEELFVQQRLCACCAHNNPWLSPHDKEISLSSLEQVPVAIPRGLVNLMEDIFSRINVDPIIMSISTSRDNAMMWAKASAAIAIVCAGEMESCDSSETFYRPLTAADPSIAKELHMTRSMVTMKKRTLSAAAQRFLTFSQAHLHTTGWASDRGG